MTIANSEIHAGVVAALMATSKTDVQAETSPSTNGHEEDSAEKTVPIAPTNDLPEGLLDQAVSSTWDKPGPAAFDFRSKTPRGSKPYHPCNANNPQAMS